MNDINANRDIAAHSASFPFIHSGFLLEAILCDELPISSRELSRARVAAAFAKNPQEKEDALRLAARLSDQARPLFWRDSLRAHMELAQHLFANGKWSECSAEVKTSLEILEKYFSAGNNGMAELHAIRGFCMAASGCLFGSQIEIARAQEMIRPRR
ncbi:MAG: hypothetical protein K2X77_33905 [Candidatus Obscuribacterales bacterium]|jgi:hypothetical protein|nr:hypothetical protein [Candidatus Obscuribacterales bacterium]